ncbi:hypothetical protein DQ04_06651000 [Trypanosoma grayi]|uniref:hypothetical protein n=1 Tax=Trypanosoma grayi TaxID=71804 RepID=UPI0004F4A1BC|nr:hypothetical protein DQ04_06651000 [Trypanosoma grayi]KEG08679.1 hypothetical protein DQ04_06651000 [Trypanosoma grayi]
MVASLALMGSIRKVSFFVKPIAHEFFAACDRNRPVTYAVTVLRRQCIFDPFMILTTTRGKTSKCFEIKFKKYVYARSAQRDVPMARWKGRRPRRYSQPSCGEMGFLIFPFAHTHWGRQICSLTSAAPSQWREARQLHEWGGE